MTVNEPLQHRPVFVETEEQTMLRETVREIAESYGHAYYLDCSKNGKGQTELWAELGRYGFLGVNIPSEYGGADGGIAELAIVCEELATAGTPSFLLIVSTAICGEYLVLHGSEEQKRDWLPRMASGETALAFSITESDAGSNSHNLATTATREGDFYRIRGTKVFASAVNHAEAMIVVARTGTDEATGRGKLSLFIVDTNAPGLEMHPIEVEAVMPEQQFTLFFDDVMVPAGRLIGEEGDGFKILFAGLNPERIMAAALENGIGLYALQKAATYARERNVWGVPIGQHQGVAHPLAKAKMEVELARLMTQKAAWLHDNGLEAGEASNTAKYAAAEACLGALDTAIQTHGGNGLATEYGLATLWGAARLQRTAPVSREMIFNYIAQHSLGLPRSY
jgi:alkylation response protein AidB-like acyl-CoA dehydrogenase